jgi:hypothetical protein
MPIPVSILNADGSLREFTLPEVANFGLDTRGIRQDGYPHRQGDQTQETLQHRCYVEPSTIDDAVCYMLGATKSYVSALDGRLHLSRNMPISYPFKAWLTTVAFCGSPGGVV